MMFAVLAFAAIAVMAGPTVALVDPGHRDQTVQSQTVDRNDAGRNIPDDRSRPTPYRGQ